LTIPAGARSDLTSSVHLFSDDESCNARQRPFGEEGSPCNVLEGKRDDDAANSRTLAGYIPQEAVGIMEPLSALPGTWFCLQLAYDSTPDLRRTSSGCNLLWSDNSTKPTCDPEVTDPAIGPYTAIFQSFGASYGGDIPGLIPVYEAGYDAPSKRSNVVEPRQYASNGYSGPSRLRQY